MADDSPSEELIIENDIMRVMKFGGTSVANFEAITRAIFIVGGRLDKKPVVVVSALS